MRAVVQRVAAAEVRIPGKTTARIGPGLLVLVGVARDDTPDDADWLARKLVRLRIFPDDADQMNRSVAETGGEILAVSQFTLHASTRKGTRPSFNDAAPPELARPLYDRFLSVLEAEHGRPPARGQFGARMEVALTNDGPVTIVIDTRSKE